MMRPLAVTAWAVAASAFGPPPPRAPPSTATSRWELVANFGREPTTWMAPEWGASGARLLLPISVAFGDGACAGEPVVGPDGSVYDRACTPELSLFQRSTVLAERDSSRLLMKATRFVSLSSCPR